MCTVAGLCAPPALRRASLHATTAFCGCLLVTGVVRELGADNEIPPDAVHIDPLGSDWEQDALQALQSAPTTAPPPPLEQALASRGQEKSKGQVKVEGPEAVTGHGVEGVMGEGGGQGAVAAASNGTGAQVAVSEEERLAAWQAYYAALGYDTSHWYGTSQLQGHAASQQQGWDVSQPQGAASMSYYSQSQPVAQQHPSYGNQLYSTHGSTGWSQYSPWYTQQANTSSYPAYHAATQPFTSTSSHYPFPGTNSYNPDTYYSSWYASHLYPSPAAAAPHPAAVAPCASTAPAPATTAASSAPATARPAVAGRAAAALPDYGDEVSDAALRGEVIVGGGGGMREVHGAAAHAGGQPAASGAMAHEEEDDGEGVCEDEEEEEDVPADGDLDDHAADLLERLIVSEQLLPPAGPAAHVVKLAGEHGAGKAGAGSSQAAGLAAGAAAREPSCAEPNQQAVDGQWAADVEGAWARYYASLGYGYGAYQDAATSSYPTYGTGPSNSQAPCPTHPGHHTHQPPHHHYPPPPPFVGPFASHPAPLHKP